MQHSVAVVVMLAFTGCIRTQRGKERQPSSAERAMYLRGTQTCYCPGNSVRFDVRYPKISMVDGVVVFKTFRYGRRWYTGYNTTTGQFTCTTPGQYSFFADFFYLNTKNDFSENITSCEIRKNNEDLATFEFDRDWGFANAHVRVNLTTGDTVYVGGCDDWDYIDKDNFWFNGYLQKTI